MNVLSQINASSINLNRTILNNLKTKLVSSTANCICKICLFSDGFRLAVVDFFREFYNSRDYKHPLPEVSPWVLGLAWDQLGFPVRLDTSVT